MDLERIMETTILEQRELGSDYDGRANDVWLVRTTEGECVVRSPRHLQ